MSNISENSNRVKDLSFWGVSPKMIIMLLPFIFLFSTLHFTLYPMFLLPFNQTIIIWIGVILIGIGLIIYAKSLKSIKKAYFSSKLVTSGIYAYMRHPLYASFILFTVPGIVCLFNSWILFFIPISYYTIFKFMIKKEEEYCMNKFGKQYSNYKSQVNAIFPKFKRYKP